MKKYLSLSLCLFVLFACKKEISGEKLFADEPSLVVNVTEAKIAATSFMNGSAQGSKQASIIASAKKGMVRVPNMPARTIRSFSNIKSSNDISSIFVVNFNEGGFCLLSNKKKAEPILAFSEIGEFNPEDNNMNAGIKIWIEQSLADIKNSDNLSEPQIIQNKNSWAMLINNTITSSSYTGVDYQQRSTAFNQRTYELLRASDYSSTVIPLSAAESYLPTVRLEHFRSIAQQRGSPEQFTIVEILDKAININIGPLIGTNWHQRSPFGSLASNGLAGCTAVAAGQIMYYYKYPTTFNWENMTEFNLMNHNDLSSFMQTLGDAFNMEYENHASGAHNRDVKIGLKRFGYRVEKKDHYLGDVDNSLSLNKPVYMSGYMNKSFFGLIYRDGHAWVCEGRNAYTPNKAFRIEWQTSSYSYQTDGIEYFQPANQTSYYYMNWGWGDRYNGWFLSTSYEQQSNMNFQYGRENLYISK